MFDQVLCVNHGSPSVCTLVGALREASGLGRDEVGIVAMFGLRGVKCSKSPRQRERVASPMCVCVCVWLESSSDHRCGAFKAVHVLGTPEGSGFGKQRATADAHLSSRAACPPAHAQAAVVGWDL